MEIDRNEQIGVECPGCGAELKIANAGGYRCFCQKCVDAMPPFPKKHGRYHIDGKYPNFSWVCA